MRFFAIENLSEKKMTRLREERYFTRGLVVLLFS